jgi:16S rRNA (guanine1207-N2)-methyltransferase
VNDTGGHGQYFEERPTAGSRPGSVRLALPDVGPFDLATDRGVFSADRIDPGTMVLLRGIPPPPADGHLLDLGCGYGPIALTLAARSPRATVWAVDVNERALQLTTQNARAAGLANVVVVPPEDVPADVRFAAAYSNPPIRIGKPTLHALLVRWLARLEPSGSAWLVVQRHLGSDSLAAWLSEQGHEVSRRRSSRGYRLLEVKPRRMPPTEPR